MRTIAYLSLLVGVCLSASGATITYSFVGQPGNQTGTPVTTGVAGITESDITRGSGLTAAPGAGSMSSLSFSTGLLDANDYYTVSLLADLGLTFDLTQMIFAERRSSNGIRDFEVRTSADGFAAPVFTANVPDDVLTRQHTVNFLGMTGLSAIEIRIYGYTAESGSGTWRLGVSGGTDNPNGFPSQLTLDVNVTVPEPGTYALAAGALAAILLRRRVQRAMLA